MDIVLGRDRVERLDLYGSNRCRFHLSNLLRDLLFCGRLLLLDVTGDLILALHHRIVLCCGHGDAGRLLALASSLRKESSIAC